MLIDYLKSALEKARYEILPADQGYFGEVPGFKGVWSEGRTLEACRTELAEVLEEWVLFRVAKNLPLPKVNGKTLKVRAVA